MLIKWLLYGSYMALMVVFPVSIIYIYIFIYLFKIVD